jgi:NADH:ubiquinone oxidoreductase subunit 4 (subunit M)
MNGRRRLDLGPVIFGAVLLFIGGYYLFRNTLGFDMPELDSEKVWPVIVIAIGVAVLVSNWTKLRGGEDTGSPR